MGLYLIFGVMMSKNRCLSYAILAVIAGCAVCAGFVKADEPSAASVRSVAAVDESGASPPGKTAVHLYFANRENGFLKSEERILVHSADPGLLGRNIMDLLIRGPQEGLSGTIPTGTSLNAFYLTPEGTAYVDLSPEIRDAHPGGIESELITIYSIVNSLVVNIPEIDAVKILIDGSESLTLTGHIDLRFPFKADMLLIR